jgi:hypothetical protein
LEGIVDKKISTGKSCEKQLVALAVANTADCFVVQGETRHLDAGVLSRSDAVSTIPRSLWKHRLSPGHCRFVLAAQLRLLARRAQLGLPLDRRSIANALRLYKTLEAAP